MKKRTTLKILFSIVFTLLIQDLTTACGCSFQDQSFRNTIDENYYIIKGVVNNHPRKDLMEVTVLENMHNKVLEDTIFINGQNGLNNLMSLNKFSMQDTLILVLNGRDDKKRGWSLLGCRTHFLKYTNGLVKGRITDLISVLSIQELRDNLSDYLKVTILVEEFRNEQNLGLLLNTTSEGFQISAKNKKIVGFEIYDFDFNELECIELDQPISSIKVDQDKYLVDERYYIKILTTEGLMFWRFYRRKVNV